MAHTPHARTLVRRNYNQSYIMSNTDDYMIVCAPNRKFYHRKKNYQRQKKTTQNQALRNISK